MIGEHKNVIVEQKFRLKDAFFTLKMTFTFKQNVCYSDGQASCFTLEILFQFKFMFR